MAQVKNLRFSFAVLGLIGALLVTPTTQAQAEAENRKSISYWIEKVKKDPGNGLHLFNLAVAYHRKKRYDKALKYYARTIRSNSRLRPAALLYMAYVLEAKKDYAKARNILNRIRIAKLPQRLKSKVERLRLKLDERDSEDFGTSSAEEEQEQSQEEKRFLAYWDIAIGKNDNPDYETSFDGSDLQYQGKLYLAYQIWAAEEWEWRGDYNFYATAYKDSSDSNTNYHTATLPLSYYFSETRIRLTPEYVIDTLDGSTFSNTSYGSLEVTQKIDSSYLGLFYQYLDSNVKDDDNSYLNGFAQIAKLNYNLQRETSDIGASLSYSDYRYQDSDDVIATYFAPSIDLSYTHYSGDWDYSGYFNYERRSYKADSSSFLRKDNKHQASLTAGKTFNSWTRFYLSLSYAYNESNDDDNDYKQFVYLLGLSGSY